MTRDFKYMKANRYKIALEASTSTYSGKNMFCDKNDSRKIWWFTIGKSYFTEATYSYAQEPITLVFGHWFIEKRILNTNTHLKCNGSTEF